MERHECRRKRRLGLCRLVRIGKLDKGFRFLEPMDAKSTGKKKNEHCFGRTKGVAGSGVKEQGGRWPLGLGQGRTGASHNFLIALHVYTVVSVDRDRGCHLIKISSQFPFHHSQIHNNN